MQPKSRFDHRMSPDATISRRVKLAPVYEWGVYLITSGLVVSGVVWLYLHYFGQIQGNYGVETNPLEPWSLKIHGAFSALALVLAGSLLTIHVTPALLQRRHLVSGLSLFGIWLVLGVTGYLLYYAGSEDLRALISKIHWIIGLVLPLLLVLHLCERTLRRGSRSKRSTRLK